MGGLGMDKRYEVPTCSRARLLVNEPRTLVLELAEALLDIVDLDADVVAVEHGRAIAGAGRVVLVEILGNADEHHRYDAVGRANNGCP